MKIDFLISKLGSGGAERVVSILANYLYEKNYEVRIITFQKSDEYEIHKEIKRIKLHKQRFFKSVIFNGFFSLLLFYRNKANRPDVMSSHIGLLGYMTIPISLIYNIKIVVSEHINHFAYKKISKTILWNVLYPFADAVTFLTDFDKDYFTSKNKNAVLMPNPCSFQPIDNDKLHQKREQVIVAVGDLNRYEMKGFDNLITIASIVLNQNPNWKLKVIGQGELGLKYLRNKAEKLNVSDKIIFTGYRDDVKDILATSEIFILSSRYEGLPMVLLEAMSQGAACIAYDCISGPSDVITDNHNGLLIDNQNMKAMENGLNELIQNESLRIQFRNNSLSTLNQFSLENVGLKWEKLIHSLKVGATQKSLRQKNNSVIVEEKVTAKPKGRG